MEVDVVIVAFVEPREGVGDVVKEGGVGLFIVQGVSKELAEEESDGGLGGEDGQRSPGMSKGEFAWALQAETQTRFPFDINERERLPSYSRCGSTTEHERHGAGSLGEDISDD